MSYIANTPSDREVMLEKIGTASGTIDDLFKAVPQSLKIDSLNLPPGKSEYEVKKVLGQLASGNTSHLQCFVGGGFYDHYIPSAIDALTSRSEFYTAYTPYQPEASQGTLQAIYEFQSAICRITGMEAANASMYDGGTAIYEAAMMALRITGRNKIIIDKGLSPIYRKMIYSYTSNLSIDFEEPPFTLGKCDRKAIAGMVDEETAAVVLQNPNFFGVIDDHSDIAEICHGKGALLIESVYPVSLGILKTPREMGADIVVGEGQSLGIPLSFGGPYLGFMATMKPYIRKMPGRIAGKTTDRHGKEGYVLTLQTREQHIRRDKATSNICTNQALCALRALIFLSLYGRTGLKELAHQCRDKAEFAKAKLREVKGITVYEDEPTFNEFLITLPIDPRTVISRMLDRGYAAGFPVARYYPELDKSLLVAITEKRTKQEISIFAEMLEDVLWN